MRERPAMMAGGSMVYDSRQMMPIGHRSEKGINCVGSEANVELAFTVLKLERGDSIGPGSFHVWMKGYFKHPTDE